jgi:acyl-CoA synthetase
MSLGQMASWGRRLAGGLHRIGVRPGDAVAFQLANGLPAAAVFYSLVHLGAVLVPIGHSMGRSELRHAVRNSGARALFVQASSITDDVIDDIIGEFVPMAGLEHIIAVGEGPLPPDVLPLDALTNGAELASTPHCDPATPAVIGWTSGSTAEPKGVLLSHRALCAEVRLHMVPLMAARRRPLLSTSPVSHVTGMLMSLLAPPLIGQDVHLMDYWDAGEVVGIMSRLSLAAGSGAPIFLQNLLDDPRCESHHHRLIDLAALGGATVPPGLVERADAVGVTAVKGYGCTEHPSISLGKRADPVALRANTDGQLCVGVTVRVRDAEGNHHESGTGEIITRGPDLFSGYLDASLNADAFDRGWYRTGDLGNLSDDGYLTVVDRLKDVIIRAGLNVSASEVEAALATLPEVAEVAVVAAPDARTGEHGCAFVRPADGRTAPDMSRIREHLAAAGLAKYKWPEEIRTHHGDFPRTPAGKVIKAALRERARRPADN